MKISVQLSDTGITLDTAQRIWESARDVLRKHGVLVTHARLRRDLCGKPGLRMDGDRVLISGELFEQRYPSPRAIHRGGQPPRTQPQPAGKQKTAPADQVTVLSGGFSMSVVDWRTGALRPATVSDLAESIRVVEESGSRGPYCVTPQDVPPILQDVATYKTCFENGRRIRGAFYSSPRQSPFIEEMCGVMNEPFRLLLGVVSPLKVSDTDIDNIYRATDQGKRYPITLVGYGMPGIGSPAALAASAAFIMAENYGVAILVSLVFPEHRVNAGVNAGGPPDFRYCNYAYGAPHTFVYQAVNAWLDAALAGLDPAENAPALSSVGLMTGACMPDEQAAAEKSAQAMLGAMLGARRFASAGNLCVDDVFSLEQFMIDVEIASRAVNTVECCSRSELMADLASFPEDLDHILGGGDFLSLPSTVEVMRAFYKPGALFEHMKLSTWQGRGSPDLRSAARAKIKEALAKSSFELPADKRSELDRIYRSAEQALANAGA